MKPQTARAQLHRSLPSPPAASRSVGPLIARAIRTRDSEPGEGATFSFTVAPAPAGPAAVPVALTA